MNHHGNKKEIGQLVQKFSRYTGMISPCFPFLSTASLRVVGQEGHTPLPVEGG